jgi:hypothetical protein
MRNRSDKSSSSTAVLWRAFCHKRNAFLRRPKVRRAQTFLRVLGMLISAVKAELETGSSGCVLLPKITSAPSAASATSRHCDRHANRRAAVEDLIEADPVAARVRAIMANRRMWTGSASDLLRVGADSRADGLSSGGPGWPKNPRAPAGRLRRAQTFLRTMGIEMTFSREGRGGARTIKIRSALETGHPRVSGGSIGTVSTVSTARAL